MFCTFPGAPVLSREIISNLTIWLFISAKDIFQCVTDLIIHLLLSLSLRMEHLITDTLYSQYYIMLAELFIYWSQDNPFLSLPVEGVKE